MHTQVAGLHTRDLSQNIFIYNSNGGLLGERVRERVSDVGLLGGGVGKVIGGLGKMSGGV